MKRPRPHKSTVAALPTDASRGPMETLWQPHGEEMKDILKAGNISAKELAGSVEIHKGEFFIAAGDVLDWARQRFLIAYEMGGTLAEVRELFCADLEAASDECLWYLEQPTPDDPS